MGINCDGNFCKNCNRKEIEDEEPLVNFHDKIIRSDKNEQNEEIETNIQNNNEPADFKITKLKTRLDPELDENFHVFK